MKKILCGVFFSILSTTTWAGCISGYTLVQSDVGVEMCSDGDDVVQIIDLKKGAKLKFLFEKDGDKFKQKHISNIWNKFKKNESRAFSVVNGTFFAPNGGKYSSTKPAQIAFLLMANGSVVTYGYENSDDYWYRKVLKIIGTNASIDDDLSYSYIDGYENALGGLSTSVDKNNWVPTIGRNLIGVSNDGSKIYILVTDGMSVASAKSILSDFGAVDIMMLDGSGSAQLRSNKKNIIGDDGGQGRLIPQAIGILSGENSQSCNSGYINGSKKGNMEPNGTYFYSASSGNYSATLTGENKASLDLDLYLFKWNNGWKKVKSSTSGSSNETINYSGTAGYYTYYVYSYSGSGNYKICTSKP